MINRRWIAAAALLAACSGGGGGGAGRVEPATTASTAVQNFMRAVADSNLTAMASLWGTAKGSAARTKQPTDYERRIAVMRSYLVHDDSRIVADAPDGSPGRHALQVQLRRQACTWTVPFTAIQLPDGGWIVNQIDLTAAGNPARPCDPSVQDTLPTGQ
ncbi:MAG TPA: hypothetical protein VMY76_06075 [Gemmatimonadales bacterium]|nr:hypothetical protein [Gemmatimonadales bacterium]